MVTATPQAFDFDAVVVGAGAVGLACGFALARRGLSVLVLEKERAIGQGVSSRNSEVIHGGLYYPTGSLKARLCVEGRRRLYPFLDAHGVAYDRCGKLVVATRDADLPELEAIERQATINGVEGLAPLSASQARALEPELNAVMALISPQSGVFDSHGYMLSLQGEIEDRGGAVVLGTPFEAAEPLAGGGFAVRAGGDDPTSLTCRILVTAPGLGAQAVAAGIAGFPLARIPTLHYGKGVYFMLHGRPPFSRLIYPPPIPGALGVHYRRDLGGQARFGPDLEYVEHEDYPVDPAREPGCVAYIRRFWPGLAGWRAQPRLRRHPPQAAWPGRAAAGLPHRWARGAWDRRSRRAVRHREPGPDQFAGHRRACRRQAGSGASGRRLMPGAPPIVLHAMLGKAFGGLEQVFLDYQPILQRLAAERGGACIALFRPGGEAERRAEARDDRLDYVAQAYSDWDPLSVSSVAAVVRHHRHRQLAVVHGQRAYRLLAGTLPTGTPIVAVIHKPSFDVDLIRTTYVCVGRTSGAGGPRARGVPAAARVRVVPNAVALDGPRVQPRRTVETPLIVAAGRLHEKKGFDILIRAMALLRDRGLDAACRIAGEGPERRRLEALIAERGLGDKVVLVGWREDLPGFLATGDVFAFPSYQEGFPLVLLQAMAAGLPIVASAIDGPSEMLAHGKSGLMVPAGEPEALANALAGLLADPVRAAAHGASARVTVERDFGYAAMTQRLGEALAAAGSF